MNDGEYLTQVEALQDKITVLRQRNGELRRERVFLKATVERLQKRGWIERIVNRLRDRWRHR